MSPESSRLHLAETRREMSVPLATSVNGDVSADNVTTGRTSAFSVTVLDVDDEQMSSMLGPTSSMSELGVGFWSLGSLVPDSASSVTLCCCSILCNLSMKDENSLNCHSFRHHLQPHHSKTQISTFSLLHFTTNNTNNWVISCICIWQIDGFIYRPHEFQDNNLRKVHYTADSCYSNGPMTMTFCTRLRHILKSALNWAKLDKNKSN